jgi:uncharacterized protein (TIGR03086 family)
VPAPLESLERADAQIRRILANVRPDQASLPTPCTEFDVRSLVNHVVYDVQSFTRTLSGAQREPPGADLIGDDWLGSYTAAADGLLSVWRARGTEGTLTTRMGELPASWVLGQHTSDLVVHAWDLARATGQSDALDPALAQPALEWGQENLKPQLRGQAFGPEVSVPADAPVYERLAAFFGRNPTWSTSSV